MLNLSVLIFLRICIDDSYYFEGGLHEGRRGLLWLFGWVMFCSSQGDSCPKQLIPLARSIADAPLHEVPQFSWGSAVLAATYRGLCTGVTKVSAEEPISVGCPLLLQLWSYERFPVGRSEMDFEPYVQLSADHDDVNRPTMGSLWCLRRVRAFTTVRLLHAFTTVPFSG